MHLQPTVDVGPQILSGQPLQAAGAGHQPGVENRSRCGVDELVPWHAEGSLDNRLGIDDPGPVDATTDRQLGKRVWVGYPHRVQVSTHVNYLLYEKQVILAHPSV